jgi:hypothetical protein
VFALQLVRFGNIPPQGYLGLKNLETLKNDKLKETLDYIYKSISPMMNYYQLICQGLIKVVESGKESGWLQIKQSNEYSRFKESSSEIDQISMQMKELDKSKSKSIARESSQEMSKQKDQLLEKLVTVYGEFSKRDKVLREKLQNDEIKAQWLQKGQRIFDYAKTKSAERQERGMTRPVIEESWRSFYRYSIQKLGPGVKRREEFDELMKAGQIKQDSESESRDSNWLKRAPGTRNLLAKNDLSPATLTEVVGAHIGSPETTVVLHKYIEAGEPGEPMIFKHGEEGFDLVSATHYGRRIPFMQADYGDIIGDGIVDQYKVDIVRGGEINIKCVIKPTDESGA